MENESTNNQSISTDKKVAQTYIAIGEETSSLLEIDLVTFREKNVEMRYLGFSFTGVNPKNDTPQEAFMNIDNEEAFYALKKFFAQLEWNS